MNTHDKKGLGSRGLKEAQQTLQEITARLRGLGAELAELSRSLPEPTQEFDARAELGGAMRSVCSDLLADAIVTLDSVARKDPLGLRLEFQKRQEWLRREL